ncbi:MAG: hypothetical protein SFX18_04125 [Pirellulales bacterium]|nr:hypothetical protein [Pirellulales bacterium]
MNDAPHPAAWQATCAEIAALLSRAHYPLIYGLSSATCEAQQLAVKLAERCRGLLDVPAGALIPSRGTPLMTVGEMRTTAAEVTHRCDLRLMIGLACPPHLYDAAQQGTGNHFWQLTSPAVNFAASDSLMSTDLRKAIHHTVIPAEHLQLVLDELLVYTQSGSAEYAAYLQRRAESLENNHPAAHALVSAEFLRAWEEAAYPVIEYSPYELEILFPRDIYHDSVRCAAICEQIEVLALARGKTGRCAVYPLTSGYNTTGAAYVLTARSGYPAAISYLRGNTEFFPGVTDAATVMSRGMTDVALVVADDIPWDWLDPGRKYTLVHLWNNYQDVDQWPDRHGDFSIQTRDVLNAERGTMVEADGVPFYMDGAKETSLPPLTDVLKLLLELVEKHTAGH